MMRPFHKEYCKRKQKEREAREAEEAAKGSGQEKNEVAFPSSSCKNKFSSQLVCLDRRVTSVTEIVQK